MLYLRGMDPRIQGLEYAKASKDEEVYASALIYG